MAELTRNTSLLIGTDVVVVSQELQGGPQRSVITIINTSTGGQKISVSSGDEAALGRGIVLAPGGFYSDTMDSGYKPSNERITAISDLAGATISIQERVVMRGI